MKNNGKKIADISYLCGLGFGVALFTTATLSPMVHGLIVGGATLLVIYLKWHVIDKWIAEQNG